MELIIEALIYAFGAWCIFKLGENMAYLRIARGLVALKEIAESQPETVEEARGVATIEKIGEQYYAYIGNDFVAQGETIDKVNEAIKAAIKQNPNKYISALRAQGAENK